MNLCTLCKGNSVCRCCLHFSTTEICRRSHATIQFYMILITSDVWYGTFNGHFKAFIPFTNWTTDYATIRWITAARIQFHAVTSGARTTVDFASSICIAFWAHSIVCRCWCLKCGNNVSIPNSTSQSAIV